MTATPEKGTAGLSGVALTPDNSLSIDFETCSTVDLRKVGARAYAEHPDTRLICVAFNKPWESTPEKRREVECVDLCSGPMPGPVRDWVCAGNPVRAWNALFEFWVWGWKVPYVSARLHPEQLHDTMAQAAYWGLPLSLDMAGEALPQLGVRKDKEGSALMKRMARPRKVHADGTTEWWHETDPEKLTRLKEYCAQDVRTEMAIGDYLPPLPDKERRVWLMDLRAQNRGVPFDWRLAGVMSGMARIEKSRLDGEMSALTGGAVPSCQASTKLLAWVRGFSGFSGVDSLAKDRLPALIERASRDPGYATLRRALELRREAAKNSVAKLDAMRCYATRAGRMHGLTQYYGAFRTGRWAGRGPQVQNFPRGSVKDTDTLVDFLRDGGVPLREKIDGVPLLFGVSVMEALSSALRGCLWVPEADGSFASVDFSQIEARVLAWLAGQEEILRAYRDGEDLYVVQAAAMFGVPKGRVTKDQRQLGKVAVLALGYQGGVGAFQTMARTYGLSNIPDHEADEIKVAWRETNPRIVGFWYDCERAAKRAVENPGQRFEVAGGLVSFAVWPSRDVLLCRLPSERMLVYRSPRLDPDPDRDGRWELTYEGVDQYTRKWCRIGTYGGKLVENIVQAVARDLMAEALLRVEDEAPGAWVLGSVHDEGLFQLARESAFGEIERIMKTPPAWAQGLPLDASGYVGRRFKKD